MDFKGHVAMREDRCHPLTVLDNHLRYLVCLKSCATAYRPLWPTPSPSVWTAVAHTNG